MLIPGCVCMRAAARTKLKKLEKEAEAKRLAALEKAAADRSPHAKEVSSLLVPGGRHPVTAEVLILSVTHAQW